MPLYRVTLPGSDLPPGNVRAKTGKEAIKLAMRAAGVTLGQLWYFPSVKRIGP